MNDNDLRDCFAMFAMMAVMPTMGGRSIGVGEPENNERFANLCYALSDAMLEARKSKEKDDEHDEDVGIARVAPKRSYRRKS
jgi:hypothetical protein